jgi:dipeptidyl aminopeptidase/acylaminoacyl peptidase
MQIRLSPVIRASVVAALAAGTVAAGVASAQAPRPVSMVEFINIPRLSEPQLSPDGTQLLLVRSDADWKANKRITHIWRVNADGSNLVQLTSSAEGESEPRWSPDGKSIAFVSKRPGAETAQIYTLASAGGEALAVTSHDTAVSRISWTPDGSALYFVAPDPKAADEKAKDKVKDDVYAYDENFKQRHLWKVTVATKSEQKLTEGQTSILDYALSPDGTKLAYTLAPTPLYGDAGQSEVWVGDARAKNAVQITKNGVTEGGVAVSPDNQQILFVSQANEKFETYHNAKIFVAPAGGGAARLVMPSLPYAIESAAWSKDGKTIYFTASMGVHAELFSVAATGGSPKQLTDGLHNVGAQNGWDFNPARGTHAFVFDLPMRPGDVWTMAEGGKPVQVTHVFDDLGKTFKLPKQEKIEWKGADGVTIEGVLTYPVDYAAGTRYPLVIATHGGPQASDRYGFGNPTYPLPVLAGKGYATLQPNYRGSTGYGDVFLRDMVGSYFKNAHLDTMAGADAVIKLGIGDPDRLIAMGWSAGGHMTDKLITFTDRFKAASSGAGASNWVSMYGQSDVRTYRTPWFGGTPWQKNAPIDVYWEHSPLKYVANVKTPTIFLVGENDVRVPLPQSVEIYRALKSNGVPTHLYVAPREPHGWGELRHQLFKMNAELDWFEKYATKRAYTWEKAPEDAKPAATTAAGTAAP